MYYCELASEQQERPFQTLLLSSGEISFSFALFSLGVVQAGLNEGGDKIKKVFLCMDSAVGSDGDINRTVQI